jgi:hypothetical protein
MSALLMPAIMGAMGVFLSVKTSFYIMGVLLSAVPVRNRMVGPQQEATSHNLGPLLDRSP